VGGGQPIIAAAPRSIGYTIQVTTESNAASPNQLSVRRRVEGGWQACFLENYLLIANDSCGGWQAGFFENYFSTAQLRKKLRN
jgi:hypothetical protein